MKFNIQSKLLLSHLQAVSKVVASKSPITILENFLFTLDGSELIITGSDQETTLTTHVPVQEVEGNGKFAANVKTLLELLKELPDVGLTITVNDANVEIVIDYQNGKFNFIGINGNEFPSKAPSEETPVEFTLSEKTIIDGIQHSVFAVGTDTLRPVMMGIFWEIKPDKIIFVASDSHKLVRYTQNNLSLGLETSFILPSKPANILASIFDRSEDPVKVTVDSKSVTFESAKYTLTSRLVNGTFPNYNSVIPSDNAYEVTIERASFLAAMRRVSVFSNSAGLIRFDLKPDSIHLSSQDMDYSSSADEDLTCEYNGLEMTIGFNDDNIIDVLSSIDAESVTVKLMDPGSAGIFVPSVQKEGEDLLVLLMPMVV